jgi:acyl-CoA reductase-like NAD-dependent aldehyde dehydrogenase
VTLELGGNDPAIICADVDLASVIPTIAVMAFVNTGQMCMSPKRIYVHESIYDTFLSALVGFVEGNLKVGDGFEEGSFLGPLANEPQYERVKNLLEDIENQGLRVASGSTKPLERKGFFIGPIIIDNPPDNSRVVVEEPFGMWRYPRRNDQIQMKLIPGRPNPPIIEVVRGSRCHPQSKPIGIWT